MLKTFVSTTCLDIVEEAMLICGFAGYANEGPYSLSRHLRDLHSARLMIHNDRVRSNTARLLMMQGPALGIGVRIESWMPRRRFRDQLFAAGLLIPMGVDGLYGRSGKFERVVDGLEAMVTRLGANDGAEVMRFPPALNRVHFERTGYLKGFPHLAGTVHCFCGNERDHREVLRCVDAGEDWTGGQRASDIVLTPAACYPIYPTLSARGMLPEHGALVDVSVLLLPARAVAGADAPADVPPA